MVYDHPVILIHTINLFSSPHGQLWALEKVQNHAATIGLLS
jgi:hypothetical protein